MFKLNPKLTELISLRRRADPDPGYSFIQQRQPQIRAALSLAAEKLFAISDQHAAVAGKLPRLGVTAERKMAVGRAYYEQQPEVLGQLARGVKLVVERLKRLGLETPAAQRLHAILSPLPVERYLGWQDLIDVYARMRQEAEAGMTMAMDLGLELDCFAWYIVKTVTAELVQVLEDPAVSEADKDQLRFGFRDLLYYKDVVLKASAQARAAGAQTDQVVAARLAEARKEELLMEVQYAVEHGHPVDADLLEQAAVWWKERKQQAAEEGAAAKSAAKDEARKARR